MVTPPTGGGGDSFEEFYAANFHPLTLQLYAYTADVNQAQDAVQEAFTRAWQRWDRLTKYDNPAAWVRHVALNVARNRWRRLRAARAHARFHRDEVVAGPSPDRVALARAMAGLPERQRRALVLFHVADLGIEEIAGQEGVAAGTVKSWLHRGRQALAAALDDSTMEGRHA
ncbi:SigE family RNA polymerase sigma factor [Micromonospora sp. PLK6-60]|uniref:SigE family RNA polymerase sigma factor n=1 Tax=Micromonospora sp. PLK6-60 TaxID=2873383 RepID=UPI00210242E7|nr:SigE family RNA polymerase sigma factor [Micromonospora sp. PLK6-60]